MAMARMMMMMEGRWKKSSRFFYFFVCHLIRALPRHFSFFRTGFEIFRASYEKWTNWLMCIGYNTIVLLRSFRRFFFLSEYSRFVKNDWAKFFVDMCVCVDLLNWLEFKFVLKWFANHFFSLALTWCVSLDCMQLHEANTAHNTPIKNNTDT